MKKNIIYIAALLLVAFTTSIFAQTKTLTVEDYARAEKMLGYSTAPFVDRAGVRPTWLPDGKFWYMVLTPTGREYVLINPADGSRKVGVSMAELGITGNAPAQGFGGRGGGGLEVASPDGKRAAYIKDWNLWMRDNETKKETQLTTDGIKDFGYATDNAGWKHSDRAILVWSPDSKKIATFQQDQRNVSDMYLVSTAVGAPKLEAWKNPIPTDKEIVKISRVIIEVDSPKVIRLKMGPDDHRSTLCDDISCGGGWDDVVWSADSKTLAFVSTPRDHKKATLQVSDEAGNVRKVYEETVATQYESGQGSVNWRYFPETNEFIWYSEKDDWGHLYLFDLNTGQLKNQITKGNFVVTQIVKIDQKSRVIYFNANGREAGRDPYFSHFYRVDFDGKNLTLLTPEDGNHQVSLSPDGKYLVDNFSKPDVPPTATLRDMTGKLIANLEKADVSRLAATGWKPPTPITVKDRNNKWDLYGLMFTPTNLDKTKKYPIVNYIYPGPQGGGVGGRSFSASRGDHQALAELGFIVVIIDGTCNPDRSKSFHDACYGNMADNTLEDQISGLKQLAQKYPFMDLTRVGIWGHSGGGFATAAAMFRFPDFYKVGISESGNHDNRNYEDDWGERYIGLMVGDNYEKQANQTYAKNLKGKLMLAHGGMDNNVPPQNTYLVVDALVKANKDFDLVIFPNARHGYGADGNYMMRRRWDYFVKNLMGAEPPKEYALTPKPDPRMAR
ncbi:MAG TPA: DPP IV N-terminal domain-containing protein [Pyrinomonadaceae bacterium]|nr:DPP IV N-terminal domain-containing protein [Pyrinomonadaceae bacterium]